MMINRFINYAIFSALLRKKKLNLNYASKAGLNVRVEKSTCISRKMCNTQVLQIHFATLAFNNLLDWNAIEMSDSTAKSLNKKGLLSVKIIPDNQKIALYW